MMKGVVSPKQTDTLNYQSTIKELEAQVADLEENLMNQDVKIMNLTKAHDAEQQQLKSELQQSTQSSKTLKDKISEQETQIE